MQSVLAMELKRLTPQSARDQISSAVAAVGVEPMLRKCMTKTHTTQARARHGSVIRETIYMFPIQ